MQEKTDNIWAKIVLFIEKRGYTLVLWALFAIMALLIILNPYRINHDCAAHLTNAKSMIEGKTLYIDIADFNPPLIYYLNYPPNLIASFFSLNTIQVFSFSVLGIIIWSTFSIRRFARQLTEQISDASPEIFVLFWVLASFHIWDINDFGQRDHLFFLMFFPFFVLRLVRWEEGEIPLSSAIINGIVGAIGVCIKPYYLLPAFAAELYWCISKRNIRNFFKPEFYAYAVTGLAYAFHFFFLSAEAKHAYFVDMMPFAVAGYYIYNAPLNKLMNSALGFPFLTIKLIDFTVIMGVIPFIVKPFKKPNLWKMSQPLALVTLFALLVFFIQHTGWSYHAIPMKYGSILLFALIITQIKPFVSKNIEKIEGVFQIRTNRYQVCLIALVICFFYGWKLVKKGVVPFTHTPVTKIVAQHSKPGDYILIVSTSTGANYPLLQQLNRRQGSRFPNHFPIPFIYGINQKNPRMAKQEEIRYFRELNEDIKKFQPRLILIDNDGYNQAMPMGFVIMEYFYQNNFVSRAMKDYIPLTTVSDRTSSYAVFKLLD